MDFDKIGQDPGVPDEPFWTIERVLSLVVAVPTTIAAFWIGANSPRLLFLTIIGLIGIWYPDTQDGPAGCVRFVAWVALLMPVFLGALLAFAVWG